MKDLDGKTPIELNNIVKSIEKLAPDSPSPVFQKKLRQQLLLKHKTMPKKIKAAHQTTKEVSLSSYFKVPFGGWSYAVAVLLIVLISGVVSYPLIPAPQVIGYSLKENVRLVSYNAPIKVVFSQPMDHGSVERAFHVEPSVAGKISWSGNSLLFYPKNPFNVGDRYDVFIGKEAKSLFQKQMEFDYEETFEIIGPPQVLLYNPAPDSENIANDAKITVLFDRPMTALKSLDEGVASAPKMIFNPPLNGKYKWLGTDSISFIPEKLLYATEYKVTIPKGTAAADGGTTDQDFSFSFVTQKPELIGTIPYDGSIYNGPDTKIRLDFNQPMKLGDANNKIHLYKYEGTGDIDNMLSSGSEALGQTAPGNDWKEITFKVEYLKQEDIKSEPTDYDYWNFNDEEKSPEDLKKSLILTPAQKLGYKSLYLATVDVSFGGEEGTFTLPKSAAVAFKTVGEVSIVSTTPENGVDMGMKINPDTGKKYSGGFYWAEIVFSHPMDSEGIEDKVWITPEKVDKDIGEKIKPSVSFSGNGTVLSIQYAFDASTDYKVGIRSGQPDQFGQKLESDFEYSFKTPALDPNFQLFQGGDISILDVNKPPIYYVKSVNTDTLDFRFKKLSDEEFRDLYADGYLNYGAVESVKGPFAGWSKRVENKFNQSIHTQIDLAKELGHNLEPGIYYFDLRSPGVVDYYGRQRVEHQVFVVTSVSLAVKRAPDKLLVWATGIADGSPMADLNISVLDNSGEEIFSGKTDKDGLASFAFPNNGPGDYYYKEYTVFGRGNGNFTLAHSSWSEGIAPWNFNIDFSPEVSHYFIYSYTDRPIYRPGHTVYFKGLVRRDLDAKFNLPDLKNVHVIVTDSQGDNVYEKDLNLNSNGTYNGELKLSDNARTGSYSISSTLIGASGPEYLNSFYTSFRIAEYRKPDYELTLEGDKDNYVDGDTARLDVKGAFFFGSPMPNADIDWTVTRQDYFFFIPFDSVSIYASKWFSFSDEGYLCFWGCEGDNEVVSSGKAKLNENGEYTLELPFNLNDKKISQLYTVEVTAHDLNNQTVSNRLILPVHQGEYYMGIMNDDYVVQQGKPAKLEVISVDYIGMPLAGKKADVALYKRKWNTIKKKNVDGGFYYENSFEDTLVETKSLTTNDKGFAAIEFTPKDGGDFRAVVTSTDSRGHGVTAATSVYVSTSGFVNWGLENNDRIELVADKPEYKSGDTAKILVKSPYENVWALVTQERNSILDTRVVKISSNSETIDVPITDASIPNVFVSVVLVKGSNDAAGLEEPPLGANDERNVAAFKIGYTTLQVDNKSKQLQIDVTTDKDKYKPREKVTVKIKTTNQSGAPAPAEVSISVVDKSVLSLTENVTADLLNEFYRIRMLGVSTAHTLTKALSRVNIMVEAGLKGGGGADRQKRGIFKDTAYWEATIETDASGNGEATFELPDNLTTWEILAIGITDDTLVGSKKHEFLVTKDVLVRPVLPRFLIMNDTMKIGGIVHNYLDRDMDFIVSLQADGVNIKDDVKKRITLKSGEEKKVEWNIEVINRQEAVLTFDVQSTFDVQIGDILEQKLPIYPFSFPEIVATAQTISDNAKHVETIWLPLGTDVNFGELGVSIAPTLSGSISKGLEYLMMFPYGCVEQTTSALLPNVILSQLLDLPIIDDDLVDKKELEKNVQAGLQLLYKFQNGNGGWGIWQTSEPTPYLTAYVLYTLNETKKAGFSVDENVINHGIEYLTSYMNSHELAKEEGIKPYSESRYQANARAYALFVLAELGHGDLALTNNLYSYKDVLNIFAKAYLVMTYDSLGGNEDKVTNLKNEILNLAKETPRGVHFEESYNIWQFFDTNTRTTALVLQMLTHVDSNNPYIPKILRNLLLEKKDGHFSTTQETAVSLIAMIDYLKTSGELDADYDATVTVNGTEKISKVFNKENLTDMESLVIPLSELMSDNQDNEVVFSKEGSGKMYADINMKYYLPTEKVEPRNEGIVVTHEYFTADDKKMEIPLSTVKLGDNLKARITLVVPEDRYYVMVEDFLPAGLEGIDFGLNTSQQSLQQEERRNMFFDSSWYFNYSEVRDDRMMYFADFLPKGVYEIEYYIRATTPGVFHDLPVLAQELYFPEVFGRSAGQILTVHE